MAKPFIVFIDTEVDPNRQSILDIGLLMIGETLFMPLRLVTLLNLSEGHSTFVDIISFITMPNISVVLWIKQVSDLTIS